jgi:hypothetical protein
VFRLLADWAQLEVLTFAVAGDLAAPGGAGPIHPRGQPAVLGEVDLT